jgi:hypothetical protein
MTLLMLMLMMLRCFLVCSVTPHIIIIDLPWLGHFATTLLLLMALIMMRFFVVMVRWLFTALTLLLSFLNSLSGLTLI